MEAAEVRKLTELETTHWWYRERRALLRRALAGVPPGRALDIGAAGGGNARVLRELGWQVVAAEWTAAGAQVCAARGLATIRADGTRLPMADHSLDLVIALDVLEHIEDDAAAVREVARVLRPGGVLLVAVPADMALWSEHDVAVGHVRRYTAPSLRLVVQGGGFAITGLGSWNVLLRPVVALRRRRSSGSDLERLPGAVNAGLGLVIAAERHLPVRRLPGVSLLLRAVTPSPGDTAPSTTVSAESRATK